MPDIQKIKSKIFIHGIITTKTGLHIGGSSIGLSIGGADSIVVRNPINNKPYIPGSSLRGKMRSLLERMRGDETLNPEGGFSISKESQEVLAGSRGDSLLGQLFGTAADSEKTKSKSLTRLIVRDALLSDKSFEILEKAPNTDMPLTEVKTEVSIDRITSAANPRQIERVPEGSDFEFEFILTLLEGDDENKFINLIHEAMILVQDDYIGGHGSRGYGKISFKVTGCYQRTAEQYKNISTLSDKEKKDPVDNCPLLEAFPAS